MRVDTRENPGCRKHAEGAGVIFAGMESDQVSLRHLLATLAYRATRALENAPDSFATFQGGGRQPIQILAHMGDLLGWALSMARGSGKWDPQGPTSWAGDLERFYSLLAPFDEFLASGAPVQAPVDRLVQGPIADALTHVGQLAMLRRMAGCPTRGENFFLAEVGDGQVGPAQPAPVRTF
jgi:hypothetical protein